MLYVIITAAITALTLAIIGGLVVVIRALIQRRRQIQKEKREGKESPTSPLEFDTLNTN